jgi:hypothetical protein
MFTHGGHAKYRAVAVTAKAIIAGDVTSAVWFLDLPEPGTEPMSGGGRLKPEELAAPIYAFETPPPLGEAADLVAVPNV